MVNIKISVWASGHYAGFHSTYVEENDCSFKCRHFMWFIVAYFHIRHIYAPINICTKCILISWCVLLISAIWAMAHAHTRGSTLNEKKSSTWWLPFYLPKPQLKSNIASLTSKTKTFFFDTDNFLIIIHRRQIEVSHKKNGIVYLHTIWNSLFCAVFLLI